MIGRKLKSMKKSSIEHNLKEYMDPALVYIPLVSQNDTNITCLVKKGDAVLIGTVIGKRKGTLRIPLLSSVSGLVTGFTEKTYLNGSKIKCVVIANDHHNTTKAIDHESLTHNQFVKLLQETGITGMGGSGFPTYLKYDTDKPINTLIVNAVECEPYITADYALIKEHVEDILEGIDLIMDINHIEEAIIAVKKSNKEVIKLFNDHIGTYLKMRLALVPDLYPAGWERSLVKDIKHVNYNLLPIEKGIIVNNVATIYAIDEAIKKGEPLVSRVVTLTGEMFKTPQNVLVRNGTSLRELITEIGGYNEAKVVRLVAGGPMMGLTLTDDDLVVTSNLNAVLALKESKIAIPTTCLRCGKCVEACPAHLSPVLIKDNLNNLKQLKTLKPQNCISCGLCSYICPAKIDVRACVKEASNQVKETLK